jgi:hypothetical protein
VPRRPRGDLDHASFNSSVSIGHTSRSGRVVKPKVRDRNAMNFSDAGDHDDGDDDNDNDGDCNDAMMKMPTGH